MHRVLVYRTELEGAVAALVNPVLEWSSKEKETSEEGCLCLPGVGVEVERPVHVRVRALDERGEPDPRRGDRPRGARDPARDGPPRRRPDPRPHVARPAQAGDAHAARAARAATGRGLRNVYLGTTDFAATVLRRARGLRRTGRGSSSPARTPSRAAARSSRRRRSPCSRASSGSRSSSPRTCTRPRSWSGSRTPEPEVLTTCAYGVLIKEPLLSDYEMINVHPSLLPRWRGAAPIERAIMAGDAETGVAIMRVTAGWDSGPVYALAERADRRRRRLRHALARASRRSAPSCSSRRSTSARRRRSRTSARSRYAHKIGPRERALDPTQRPEEVERTIRALRPHIGSRLPLPDGTFLGVIAAQVAGPTLAPAGGRVRTDGDRLLLDCNGGALELTEVRPPGGRPMAAADWLRGRPDQRLTNFRFDPALPGRELDELVERARAEWVDPAEEWQPHVCALAARGDPRRARRDDRARRRTRAADRASSPRTSSASSARPAVATRPSRTAALRAIAEREAGPEVLAAIACAFGHLGAPARHRLAARPRRRPGRGRPRGGRVRARRPPGRRRPPGADRALRRRRGRRPRLGDVRARHAGRGGQPELRDALAARLDDPDEETRLEAVHGLAVRGDPRADEPARDLLAAHGDAEGEGVWTRHLLAETASHIDGLTRLGRRNRRPRVRRRSDTAGCGGRLLASERP